MKSFRVVLLSTAFVLAFLIPTTAMAQGCALCYTQAAGAGMKMIQALKSGILVLVFPPMGICVLLTWMGYKKRNKFHSIAADPDSPEENRPNSDLGW
jgi:hypothetical protein